MSIPVIFKTMAKNRFDSNKYLVRTLIEAEGHLGCQRTKSRSSRLVNHSLVFYRTKLFPPKEKSVSVILELPSRLQTLLLDRSIHNRLTTIL